jgi:L-iditol 2-dehydrogenase
MLAVRYYAPGDVRVEDRPEPDPGPGDVMVRVRCCSVCGTDRKISRYGHHLLSPPRILGHEIAGEIASLGPGVTGWAEGDRVQVIGAIPCGTCRECRQDRMTVCQHKEAMGYQYDGVFAEYLRVPAKVLAVGGMNPIPAGTGFAAASLADPLSCVLNAQELAGGTDGAEVLVIGDGPAGCLHVLAVRARGAARVLLAGRTRDHLARAATLTSPDEVICTADGDLPGQVLELTSGRGADVVIIAVGSGAAQAQALRCAAPRGRVSLYGSLPPGEPAPALDANLIHYRELMLVGAWSSSPAQNTRALGLIASGAIPVAGLITHRFPLERFTDALAANEDGAIKVAIEP